MESRSPAALPVGVYPVNVSVPKFHLFQPVTVKPEHSPQTADNGRIIGILFDPDKSLQCHWWYVVEYPDGMKSSPWLELGHKNEVPESEITQREA